MTPLDQQHTTETTDQQLQIQQIEQKNPSDFTADELKMFVQWVRHELIANPETKQQQIDAGIALIDECKDKPEHQTILNNIIAKTNYPLSSLARALSNGKSVLKDYLDFQTTGSLTNLSSFLTNPDTTKQDKAMSFLTSGIETKYTDAFPDTPDIFSTSLDRNEILQNDIETSAQIVAQAKASQSEALTNHPDLAKDLKPVSDLDKLTTPDQQIAFATDQLGYDQAQATEIIKNYENSQYSEAWLSIGQLLSFLQTEQALWNNGIDSDPFLADVAQIRDDLQISAPKTKKRNLTYSQIPFFVM